jgi:hypothetical protein
MPSILNEALEWLDRAEQAREVAGQLTDPDARKAVLELANSFDWAARAAANPAVLRRRELARTAWRPSSPPSTGSDLSRPPGQKYVGGNAP